MPLPWEIPEVPGQAAAPLGRPRRRQPVDLLGAPLPPETFSEPAPIGAPGLVGPPGVDLMGAPLQPPQIPEAPPDDPGLIAQIGDVLDRPGNAVRSTIAGIAGLDAGKIGHGLAGLATLPLSLVEMGLPALGVKQDSLPSHYLFDPRKHHTSGQDVNEAVLGIPKSDSFLSPAGIAGFGTEMLTDPLMYVPGAAGVKASTTAGEATAKLLPHLTEAETVMERAARAAKEFGKYALANPELEEEALAAKRQALMPKVPTGPVSDLLGGDVLKNAAENGEVLSRRAMAEQLASRPGPLGEAAADVLKNAWERGLTDEQAFDLASQAGDRVRAGQEALFQVGGHSDPLGLLRLGGKYNPLNHLNKLTGDIPLLTKGIELPQRTLIEGADAAQAMQDVGQKIVNAPGIKDARDLFRSMPNVPDKYRNVMLELLRTSRGEEHAALEAAAHESKGLHDQIEGVGPLGEPVRPPAPVPDVPLENPNKSEWLGMPELSPESADALQKLDEGPPSTFKTAKMPETPPGMERPATVAGSRVTPLEDVTARPQPDDFAIPKIGDKVRFKATNALQHGVLNNEVVGGLQSGQIDNVFNFQGQDVAQIGDWHVPLDQLKRPARDVQRDYQTALDAYERDRVYGGLSKADAAELKRRAQDARVAHLDTMPDFSGPRDVGINAEVKAKRNQTLDLLGMKETGDAEQAAALPKFIEQALDKGKVPNLKTVDFLSFDNGTVGIGDELRIGGDTFTVKGPTPEGKIRLQDGIPIEVPPEFIPIDKGTKIKQSGPLGEPGDFLQGIEGEKKFARQNKAADVLAGTEAKLGVQPTDFSQESGRLPDQAPEISPAAAPPAKDLLGGDFDQKTKLMNEEIERLYTTPRTAPTPGEYGPLGESVKQDVKQIGDAGAAANPPRVQSPAEQLTDKADQIIAQNPNLPGGQSKADAIAASTARTDPAEIMRQNPGMTEDQAHAAANDNYRRNIDQIGATRSQRKVAAHFESVGQSVDEAVKNARELLPDDTAPAVHREITKLLEHGGTGPEQLMDIAKGIREKYQTMLELEQARGLASPELNSERIDYTTHVATGEGRQFFKRLARDENMQVATFRALEEKRIAGGIEPNPENLKTKQQLNGGGPPPGTDLGPAPEYSKKGLSKAQQEAAGVRLMKVNPEDHAWLVQNDLVREYLDWSKDIKATHGSQIPRMPQYKHLGIDELNDVFKESGATGPVFNENPAAQVNTREVRHIKAMASADYLDNVAAKFGADVAPHHAGVTRDGVTLYPDGSAGVEAYDKILGNRGAPPIAFPHPEMAQALRDYLEKVNNPEQVNELVSWYDKTTHYLKSFITRPFPAFHARNHIENELKSWLGGVPLSGWHRELAPEILAGKDVSMEIGNKVFNRDEILKMFQESGGGKGGHFEQLLKESADPTAKASYNIFDPNSAFIQGAERLSSGLTMAPGAIAAGVPNLATHATGQIVEDTDRLAHWLYKVKEGFSPAAAAADTDKFLFDLSKDSLSPFEQKYMNRGVFFYNYTSKSMALMLDQMLNNTGKVKQLAQLGLQPGQAEHKPQYAREAMGVPLGKDADGNSQMAYGLGTPLEGALDPLTGFASGPRRGLEGLLKSLNPIVRTPLEVGANRDFFLGQSIDESRKAPHWMEDLPEEMQKTLGVVKIPKKDGTFKYEMDPWAAYALRNSPLSRVSNTAGRLTDERKGGAENALNLLTGARIVSIDDADQLERAKKDAIRARLHELELQGKVRSPEIYTSDVAGKGDPEVKMLLKALSGK